MRGSLEERKEAFKKDEELMKETTKFVSEVIAAATTEASKRKSQSEVKHFANLCYFQQSLTFS